MINFVFFMLPPNSSAFAWLLSEFGALASLKKI
jgi:hypothetical protein